MSLTAHITTIHDLLEEWRALGSRRLRNGVELIGRMPVDDEWAWMHAVFPGLDVRSLDEVERAIGVALPGTLRTFYRRCGGMSLFLGAFRLGGRAPVGLRTGDEALHPVDIVALNHELDVLGWRPGHAVAFAENRWDLSVHVAGIEPGSERVARCDRRTGAVIEEHADVFACIADRLHRLDQLLLR